MNILDENVLESQRQLLQKWRVPFRQIGYEVGRKGMKDDVIVNLTPKPSAWVLSFAPHTQDLRCGVFMPSKKCISIGLTNHANDNHLGLR
jgi:hypothetical protein